MRSTLTFASKKAMLAKAMDTRRFMSMDVYKNKKIISGNGELRAMTIW